MNQSGIAVAAWSLFEGRKQVVYASYREAADAESTPMELVAKDASSEEVGIDDAGHVLLLFSRGHNARTRLYAVRRTPTDGWGPSTRLARGCSQDDFALGANGTAMVVRTRVSDDGDIPRGSQFTRRMTPSGRWQPPVRQPALTEAVQGRSVDMDAKGRALMAWWDDTDLIVRWSRPEGKWRRPCVVATDVKSRFQSIPALGFGEDGFAYPTWTQSGQVAYSAVQKVVASHDCLVIVALSEDIFWALPADLIPAEATSRMSGAPAGA